MKIEVLNVTETLKDLEMNGFNGTAEIYAKLKKKLSEIFKGSFLYNPIGSSNPYVIIEPEKILMSSDLMLYLQELPFVEKPSVKAEDIEKSFTIDNWIRNFVFTNDENEYELIPVCKFVLKVNTTYHEGKNSVGYPAYFGDINISISISYDADKCSTTKFRKLDLIYSHK